MPEGKPLTTAYDVVRIGLDWKGIAMGPDRRKTSNATVANVANKVASRPGP